MENKTHYRKVFKSDHLGVADLEDLLEEKRRLVFTIKEVKQYIKTDDGNSGIVVAGRRIGANIAYFTENIKPLVLNATNSKVVKKFNGGSPFVEDWGDTIIELYIDANVKMKGDIVGGVRISPNQPSKALPDLTPSNEGVWFNAITALKEGKGIDVILKRYTVSEKHQKELLAEAEVDNT